MDLSFIDLKDNTYGIDYKYFIDVHDIENQTFLYRIKPIDNGETLRLIPLIDETFLYIGNNKSYIFSILEKKAYQIHYETQIKFSKFIQLCDERILSDELNGLCIYEKDSSGIFQKKIQKKLPYLKHFIQISDDLILGRDSSNIYFIDSNTLDITDTIHYSCWNEYASDIGMLSENLCVIKNAKKTREYALIDLKKKCITEYATKSEEELEYKQSYEYDVFNRADIMTRALPLPDGSLFTKSFMGDWTLSTNSIIYWDSRNKEISGKGLPQFQNETGRNMDTTILSVFQNGCVFVVTNDYTIKMPEKYYLLK